MTTPEAGRRAPLPPGAMGLYPLGESVDFLRRGDDFVHARVEAHGPIFKSRIFFRPTVFLGTPELTEQLLEHEDALECSVPPAIRHLMTPYGAMNLEGPPHRATRKVLSSLVASPAQKACLPLLQERARTAVDALPSEPFSLTERVFDYAVHCAAEIFMGAKLEADEVEAYRDYSAGFYGLVPWPLPGTALGRGNRALKRLRTRVLQAMRTGRRSFLFEQLANARDERGQSWSDERRASMGVLLTWAAHEEVASTLTTLLHTLCRHPNVVAELRQERQAADDTPDLPGLRALKWHWAAYHESQRLFPATFGSFRRLKRTLEVGGHRLPEGWIVVPEPLITHYRADVHPQPRAFQPERFFSARAWHKLAFIPGGTGQHACPGLQLGAVMALCYVAELIRRYDIVPLPDQTERWSKVPFRRLDPRYLVRAVPVAHARQPAEAAL